MENSDSPTYFEKNNIEIIKKLSLNDEYRKAYANCLNKYFKG
jgi:hypothetical protein